MRKLPKNTVFIKKKARVPPLFQQSHRAHAVCQGLSQAPKSSTFVEPYVCRARSHSHRTSIVLSPESLVILHCTQGTQVLRGKVISLRPLGYVAEGLRKGVTGHGPQAPHRLTYHHCSRCPCRASGPSSQLLAKITSWF